MYLLFFKNNILLVRIPVNLAPIFQLLDLTVNGTFKMFMHEMFSEWYCRQILHTLENGCEVKDAKVNVKLTIMKPLHAKGLFEFYYYINSSDGQKTTRNGWLRAGITDAVNPIQDGPFRGCSGTGMSGAKRPTCLNSVTQILQR